MASAKGPGKSTKHVAPVLKLLLPTVGIYLQSANKRWRMKQMTARNDGEPAHGNSVGRPEKLNLDPPFPLPQPS
eukprot:1161762-Pelagomonas_calceolata.AAC.15